MRPPHFQYKTDQAEKKHKEVTQLKRHNNVELMGTCQKLHPDKYILFSYIHKTVQKLII